MDDTLRTIPADKENTATRLTFDYENVKDSTGVDSKEHHVNQPYPLKVPPHVRRLGGVKVSSPSDNLSPCSQKLMATNLRHGTKPRSFQSMLKNGGESHLAIPESNGINKVYKVCKVNEADDPGDSNHQMDVENLPEEQDDESSLVESPTRNIPLHRHP